MMETKEAIETLKKYNKWRRGKGKKYSQPGMPLDVVKIGEAIDHAIEHLSYRISPAHFIEIVDAATIMSKHDDRVFATDDVDHRKLLKEAVAAAKKVKTRILKRQAK